MESKIKRQDRAINSCQVTTRKKNKPVAKKLTIFKVVTGCVWGGVREGGGSKKSK